MRRAFACLLFALVALLPAFAAKAQGTEGVTFRVGETSASPNIRLAGQRLRQGDALYVRIVYSSDRPVRFRVEGHAGGVKLEKGAMYNPAPLLPAAQGGEGLTWIAYRADVAIDMLVVSAHDAKWKKLASLSEPLTISWAADAPRAGPRPAWAQRLSDAQQKAAVQAMQPVDPSPMGNALISLIFLAVPGYFLLQALALWRLEGGWRLAGLVPLLGAVPLAGHALFALGAGSNLWPLLFIFFAPLGAAYLVVLFAARWLREGDGLLPAR